MSCPCPLLVLVLTLTGLCRGQGICLNRKQTLPSLKSAGFARFVCLAWLISLYVIVGPLLLLAGVGHRKDMAKRTKSSVGELWNCILILQLEALCCHYHSTHLCAWGISTESHASTQFNGTVEKGDGMMVSESIGSLSDQEHCILRMAPLLSWI